MRAFAAALLALLLVAPAFGQDEKKPPAPGPFTQRLKEPLGLTDEQLGKVAAIEAEMRDAGDKLREMVQNGEIDQAEAREKLQENRKKAVEKIRDLLEPEQRKKLPEVLERLRGENENPAMAEAERNRRRLSEAAEKALEGATDDEKTTLRPLVKKVVDARFDAQTAQAKRRAELLELAAKKTEKDELAAKIAEFRKAADSDREKVKQAQTALRDLLTVELEAKLVGIGLLD